MRRTLLRVILVFLITGGGLATVVATGTTPQLGLDLQGGLSIVLAPKGNQGNIGDRLDKAVDIVRSRVDALGVAEPEISHQGNTIVVDLPGVEEQERARKLIGKTAELQFRPVVNILPATSAEGVTDVDDLLSTSSTTPGAPAEPTTVPAETPPTTTAPSAQGLGGGSADARILGRAQETPTTTAPAEPTTVPAETTPTTVAPSEVIGAGGEFPADEPIVATDAEGGLIYQLGPAEVTGRAVKSARATFETGEWSVLVEFTKDGSVAWDAMAAQYFQQQVAIVLDGVVQSAPTIQTEEFGGEASITGNFSQSEAKDLALVLRFGALPVELEQISVQEVSATFGRDQLDAGIVAGIVGLLIVAIYVFAYYRILGTVVWLSLIVTGAALYAIVAWLSDAIGLTLTIAGVVGLIVSIGIAADSNIVYFERLKEEMRGGRTVRSAADRAFKAAFRTILAADFVTLLAAVLLWLVAIGSVKGFAFYLGLATVLDLAVSWFFMHPLVVLLGRSRRLSRSRWLGISHIMGAEKETATS